MAGRPWDRTFAGADDPAFRDRFLFYEYFHGEDGHGLGAAHQTGWTALIANLLDEIHRPTAAS